MSQEFTHDNRKQPPVRRKKHRRSASGANALLYVLFVIGVSLLLACLTWIAANDILALNKAEHSAVIVVETDESFGDVVSDLKENGIIEHKLLFRLFAVFTHGASKISDGTYELNTNMDYRAIITNLGSSSTTMLSTTVTIPEGYTAAQIFQLLDDKGVTDVASLEDAAANHDYDFSFLSDIPLGEPNRLEGYLFPDTYEFYMGQDALYVINKMLQNFDSKFTDEMRQTIADSGMNIHDIVTIASLIEKETDGDDQQNISSVIYNRINNVSGPTVGLLQLDSTIQYVLDERKEKLSEADLAIDSPYNTYLHKGLPAGPIANPGMTAIYAAMNPNDTSYYYFLTGSDGTTQFFKTYNSFLSAKAALSDD